MHVLLFLRVGCYPCFALSVSSSGVVDALFMGRSFMFYACSALLARWVFSMLYPFCVSLAGVVEHVATERRRRKKNVRVGRFIGCQPEAEGASSLS